VRIWRSCGYFSESIHNLLLRNSGVCG
jgi:hypothetical protein